MNTRPSEASTLAAPGELLAVENLEVLYAKVILALKGVNLRVEQGRCTVLLGPNGAGKSTTLKAISGVLATDDGEVSAGSVRFNGELITGAGAQSTVSSGLIHVVEGRKVLRHLTVEQNLLVGGHLLPNLARVRERLAFVFETIPRLAALRETSILFGLLIAVVFLKEPVTRARAAGALTIALGAGFLVATS